MLFVNLYGNDVIWQTSDFSSPNVTEYTGDLKAAPGTTNLVPDDSRGTPNLQLEWLEKTLSEARRQSFGAPPRLSPCAAHSDLRRLGRARPNAAVPLRAIS